ncbi:MAG: hypothetical protein K8R48_07990 [Alphaproteobacteria bacterium]|nr:hypothetical protein [Alphaproteobacteria bacterium]
MGAVIVVLAVIGLLVLLVYLKFPPPFANAKTIGVYDKMVLGVCGVLCLLWFLNARATWMGTDDDKWWIPLGILGALAIEIGFLGICFLMRNFWIFKPPRRPGGL